MKFSKLSNFRFKMFYSALIILVILVIFFVLHLTGILAMPKSEASENDAVHNPDKIKIMVDTTFRPFIEKIGDEYEKQYGIKVEINSMDYNRLHDSIEKNILSADTDVDVVQVDTLWIPEFARAGFLQSLRNYVPSDLRDKMIPIAYDQCLVNNDLYAFPELYAFPVTLEEKFLYYNAKMLKKAGIYAPPNTWDELIDMAQYLKEKGLAKYGIVWGWDHGEGLVSDYTMLLNAFGGQFKDANGNWVFNTGGGQQALNFMMSSLKSNDLSDPLSINLNDASAINRFKAGDIPFLISWSYANKFLNQNPDIKTALVPGFKGFQRSSTVIGGGALGITMNSKHKEWAWKFIDLMNSKKNVISASDFIGSLPVWNDEIDNAKLKENYLGTNLATDQFQYAINRPSMSAYVEWSNILQTSIKAVLTGKQKPKDALNEALKLIQGKGIK